MLALARAFYGWHLVTTGQGWDTVEKALRTGGGKVLIVMMHSRCTLDMVLLVAELHRRAETLRGGRTPGCIAHPLCFNILPPLAWACRRMGCTPAGDEGAFVDAMADRGVVIVAPGGAHEMLKTGTQDAYRVRWRTEPGFAHLAKAHGWAVVPCSVSNSEGCLFNPLWHLGLGRCIAAMSAWARQPTSALGHYGLFTPVVGLLAFLWQALCVPVPCTMAARFGEALRAADDESAGAFAQRVRRALQTLVDSTQRGTWGAAGDGPTQAGHHAPRMG